MSNGDSVTYHGLYSSGLSFTQGFLLGQLSVCILIFAFIKFFIFGEASSSSGSSGPHLSTLSPRHRRSFTASTAPSWAYDGTNSSGITPRKRRPSSSTTSSHIIRPPLPLTPALILRKTYYNVPHHQPESLDWFNVLVAQTIAQLRADAATDDAILKSLTSILNGPVKPDFLANIAVTEIALGEDFPIFSNCRVHPIDDDVDGGKGEGRLEARMDVDLSDFITLGVETTLVLNYPRPRTAVLPVALSVSVVRFSGTLSISFLPASTSPLDPGPAGNSDGHGAGRTSSTGQSTRTPTTLAFSFLPNYTLSLSTRSLLGARSRLQDVPKIAQLVEARLRTWFEERCVTPRRQQILIPSLWPRMRNVVDERDRSGGLGGSGGAGPEQGPVGEEGTGQQQQQQGRPRPKTEERRERGRDGGRDRIDPYLEGLRYRGMAGQGSAVAETPQADRGTAFDMPGSMPGMMVR